MYVRMYVESNVFEIISNVYLIKFFKYIFFFCKEDDSYAAKCSGKYNINKNLILSINILRHKYVRKFIALSSQSYGLEFGA